MRSLVTLVFAYLLLILQSTVLELAPVRMAAPSLGLLVVLHVGLSPKWSLSSAAVVSFVTGYLLGSYLDRKLGTSPWLVMVGVLLGTAAGFVGLFRTVSRNLK